MQINTVLLTALLGASLSAAAPLEFFKRQFGGLGMTTANDLKNGACKPVGI